MYIYLLIILLVWNIIVFSLYGIDKRKAKKKAYRISEKTLIFSSFALGAVGASMGMYVFRHKTKHTKFKILVPLSLIVNAICVYYAWRELGLFL